MNNQPIALTNEILDAYCAASKAAGSSFSEGLLPGLTDEEVTAVTEPLGIVPTGEVRTLWRWGVVPEHPKEFGSSEVSYILDLLPPQRVVQETENEQVLSFTGQTPPAEWLVIGLGNSAAVSVDCTGTPEIGPVWESAKGTDPERMGPSLGALFVHWTELIETGEMELYGRSWSGKTGTPYASLG